MHDIESADEKQCYAAPLAATLLTFTLDEELFDSHSMKNRFAVEDFLPSQKFRCRSKTLRLLPSLM